MSDQLTAWPVKPGTWTLAVETAGLKYVVVPPGLQLVIKNAALEWTGDGAVAQVFIHQSDTRCLFATLHSMTSSQFCGEFVLENCAAMVETVLVAPTPPPHAGAAHIARTPVIHLSGLVLSIEDDHDHDEEEESAEEN